MKIICSLFAILALSINAYLRNSIIIKTDSLINYRNTRRNRFPRNAAAFGKSVKLQSLNDTRNYITLEFPMINHIYWDDGEIVWEFREEDETNDNKTSVRVKIDLPPVDPVVNRHMLAV